ncbi:MAG: signal recognition particle receptor subunit alpha [Nitrospinae bacterium]|nr:signal recognition particle receptor subunit alpha [Nitrospinota bacterium]
MFENLSTRLEAIYKKLKGRGLLKEPDVDEALREIRIALIEADVSLPVIKDYLADIREKAIGQEILKSLTPGHQMVKVVNDHLTQLLGDGFHDIEFASKPPTIILMAGLQGSGKKTTVGKLAKRFKTKGKKCLLVPADVYRPAAPKFLRPGRHPQRQVGGTAVATDFTKLVTVEFVATMKTELMKLNVGLMP